MPGKNESKFKSFASKTRPRSLEKEHIPFFPKYETHYMFKECLRATWFESAFSQSNYHYENNANGSNACTLITVLVAAKCHNYDVDLEGPEKPINPKIIYVLAHGMLTGNAIHDDLKARGVLSNINLTVPEAVKHSGELVAGIREWKSELYPQPMALTLYENLKRLWREWRFYCSLKKRTADLYVVLICDSRSVLFIMKDEQDTVTLVDSHQHSREKGAFIATVCRNRLKILCRWFSDLIYQCYKSYPYVYELALLYFSSKSRKRGRRR